MASVSGSVILVDEQELRGHLDEVVRTSVEETLNGLLDAEADRLFQAKRYERTADRVDTRRDGANVSGDRRSRRNRLRRPRRNGRRALVTGITGQDDSYLTGLLLAKGYEVFGDLTDASPINHALKTIRPDEVYSLGRQSHVRVSFDIPEYTAAVTGMGAVRVLESMRELGLEARFYQASSSEMFGASTCSS